MGSSSQSSYLKSMVLWKDVLPAPIMASINHSACTNLSLLVSVVAPYIAAAVYAREEMELKSSAE